MYHQYDQEFKEFLESNLDYGRLKINRDFKASQRLLSAIEYFDGIPEFIRTYFEPGEINHV